MAIISASKTLPFNTTFDYSNPIGIVETLFDFLANESDFLDKDNAEGEIAAVVNAARDKVKKKKVEAKEREAVLRKSRMKDEPMEESDAREPLNSRLVKIVSIEGTVDSVPEERLSNLEKSVQGIADQVAIIIAKMNDDGVVRNLRLNRADDVGMKREKRENLEDYTDYINKKFEQEKERKELLKRDIIEQVRDGLSVPDFQWGGIL
ncbi:protein BOBBER 2-like [Euphorbia lathyris]|uniref:protein BOBBER 2-like n=1 Tax=Euphorbia lathyris TaxID=212925 RepID=UPI0033130AA5